MLCLSVGEKGAELVDSLVFVIGGYFQFQPNVYRGFLYPYFKYLSWILLSYILFCFFITFLLISLFYGLSLLNLHMNYATFA